MRINVTVRVDANQLTIHMPDKGWFEQLPNIIAVDKDNRIRAIGEEADELSRATDDENALAALNLRYINPFEFDKHDMRYAVNILDFLIVKALKGWRTFILGGMFRRLDLDIWLWNYEALSPEVIYDFEAALRKQRALKVGQVLINGQDMAKLAPAFVQQRRLEERYRKIASTSFNIFKEVWILLVFIGYIWFSRLGGLFAPITFDGSGLIRLGALLPAIALIFVGGPLIGAVSWMVIMRHFVPVEIMKECLPTSGASRPMIQWAAERVLG